jgi:YHS domain-containing protein
MDASTAVPDARRPIPFDPVCGSPLPALYEANPYCDGGYTYYFCSAMCRRFFIDQRDAERRGATNRPPAPEARV